MCVQVRDDDGSCQVLTTEKACLGHSTSSFDRSAYCSWNAAPAPGRCSFASTSLSLSSHDIVYVLILSTLVEMALGLPVLQLTAILDAPVLREAHAEVLPVASGLSGEKASSMELHPQSVRLDKQPIESRSKKSIKKVRRTINRIENGVLEIHRSAKGSNFIPHYSDVAHFSELLRFLFNKVRTVVLSHTMSNTLFIV